MAYELRKQDNTLIITLTEDTADAKGAIESERMKKNANLDNFAMPMMESAEQISMDYNGADMTITLRGNFVAKNLTVLKARADSLRNLIAPSTNSPRTQKVIKYISEFIADSGVIYVKINSLDIDKESGVPLKFTYTMELIECSVANDVNA